MLILIRHASVLKDPDIPAEEWRLDERGAAALVALRGRHDWGRVSRWYSSGEPKALATAAALTDVPVVRVPELGEVRRSGWQRDYDGVVLRLLSAPEVPPAPGWETAVQALARFDAALRALAEPGASAAVVTHGLVLSLWRGMLRRAPVDLDEWRQLRFPDVLVLPDDGVNRWLARDKYPIDLTRLDQVSETCPADRLGTGQAYDHRWAG